MDRSAPHPAVVRGYPLSFSRNALLEASLKGLNRRFGALSSERVKLRLAKPQVTFSLTLSLNVGKSAFREKLSRYPPTIRPRGTRNSPPKLYLGKEERVLEIKRECVGANEQWREYATDLKPPKMTFLESFPDIF